MVNFEKEFSDNYSEDKEIFDAKFEKFINLLEKSKSITVLTGAGVSTLSGIPDFRGDHGVYTDPWKGLSVEEIISLSYFRRHPDVFYKWARDVWYRLDEYEPDIVHKTLAKLEKDSCFKDSFTGIFTQNIDMLHQRAGSRKVYELHGSPEYHYCTKCGKIYGYSEIKPIVLRGDVPYCTETKNGCVCNGVIKPKIVFYEESLPEKEVFEADRAFKNTDLCLVLGSSLVVYPVAFYPEIAKRAGAKIVFVNAQNAERYSEAFFDIHFRDLRQTFEALNKYLGGNL